MQSLDDPQIPDIVPASLGKSGNRAYSGNRPRGRHAPVAPVCTTCTPRRQGLIPISARQLRLGHAKSPSRRKGRKPPCDGLSRYALKSPINPGRSADGGGGGEQGLCCPRGRRGPEHSNSCGVDNRASSDAQAKGSGEITGGHKPLRLSCLAVIYAAAGAVLVVGGVVVTVATGGLAGFVIGGALAGAGFGFGTTGMATHDFGAALQAGVIGAVAGAVGGAASFGVIGAMGGMAAVGGMSLLGQLGVGALSGGAGGFAGGFAGGTLGGLAAGQSWGQALQSGWNAGVTGAMWGAAIGAAVPIVARGIQESRLAVGTLRAIRRQGAIPEIGRGAQSLTKTPGGYLLESTRRSGLRGLWRNFRIVRSATKMGYQRPELVRYVEEIGVNPDSGGVSRGGVYYRGQILLDKWAFNRSFLAQQHMLSFRTVLAHEIGHGIAPLELAAGVYRLHPEFWASTKGSTLPGLASAERANLVSHGMWRFPS